MKTPRALAIGKLTVDTEGVVNWEDLIGESFQWTSERLTGTGGHLCKRSVVREVEVTQRRIGQMLMCAGPVDVGLSDMAPATP